MKKILNYIALGVFITFAYSCEEEITSNSVNYVTFEASPSSFKVDKDATSTKDVKVYAGNKTGSDRTYTVLVNESSTLTTTYSVPGTVTIPANSNEGSLSISVTDDESLQYEAQTLVLDFVNEGGQNLGGSLTVNIAELCPNTIAKLTISLDNYPEETTWEIYDLSGTPTVIFSGGPYVNPDDNDGQYSYEFCLVSGDYGVVVYDSYGDGGSSFTVSAGGTTLASGTVNTASASETFTIE